MCTDNVPSSPATFPSPGSPRSECPNSSERLSGQIVHSAFPHLQRPDGAYIFFEKPFLHSTNLRLRGNDLSCDIFLCPRSTAFEDTRFGHGPNTPVTGFGSNRRFSCACGKHLLLTAVKCPSFLQTFVTPLIGQRTVSGWLPLRHRQLRHNTCLRGRGLFFAWLPRTHHIPVSVANFLPSNAAMTNFRPLPSSIQQRRPAYVDQF